MPVRVAGPVPEQTSAKSVSQQCLMTRLAVREKLSIRPGSYAGDIAGIPAARGPPAGIADTMQQWVEIGHLRRVHDAVTAHPVPQKLRRQRHAGIPAPGAVPDRLCGQDLSGESRLAADFCQPIQPRGLTEDPAMSHLLHRNVGTMPFVAVDAKGMVIRSSDGREVIDGSGGAAVACLGHGNERVLDAIREQLARVTSAHTGFYTTSPAEELAELLVGHEPGGLSQAYFVSSGSEATEAALKLARQYMLEIGEPARDWFIGRRQSYHGNTLGALAVGGN